MSHRKIPEEGEASLRHKGRHIQAKMENAAAKLLWETLRGTIGSGLRRFLPGGKGVREDAENTWD